jgi:maltose/moltooligosaccharide transporter
MPNSQLKNIQAKPLLSTAQIINMSVGFFGIQFLFGLQNGSVSRIFQTMGAEIDDISGLWIAAPLTGLIVQPLIGHLSDKTWHPKWGRRRPYFMIGAILASIALFMFPNVNTLLAAAIMLWLLDASINISMEPFRAFVGDMLPDEQRTKGFAMQSFFIGIGAVISSVLPWLLTQWGVANEAPKGIVPDSVRISFYIGVAVVLSAIFYTVFTTKEYNPEQQKSFGEIDEQEDRNAVNIQTPLSVFLKRGLTWMTIGLSLSALLYWYNTESSFPLKKEVYVLTFGVAAYGLYQLIAWFFMKNKKLNGVVEIADDLNHLNPMMKQLAVVQFFSWFALFSMWIYSTPGLAQHLYHTTDPTSKEYNNLSNAVGWLFAAYNGFAAIFAFLLPVMAKKLSRPKAHAVSLVAGGLGLISFIAFKNEYLLLISMAGVGLAWCSILAMPYSLLTQSLPAKKMGVYMGIFNFFIVIPQILAATLLGLFTQYLFKGQAIYTIVLGGCTMIIAAFFSMRIKDKIAQ